MDYFRKKCLNSASPLPSSGVCDSIQSKNVEYEKDGLTKIIVEFRKVTQDKLLKVSNIPNAEDYSLEVMLKNGYKPTEVPTTGLLDSYDPLDGSATSIVEDGMKTLESFEVNDSAKETIVSEDVEQINN